MTAFHPLVQSWFARTFGEPSPPQAQGWPSIAAGNHTLIVAPTGSGKTLAAFLWCINRLVEEKLSPDPDEPESGVRVLYISPLKALNNDIHRNLDIPLRGIEEEALSRNLPLPKIRAALRTGDTTQQQRRAIVSHPPEILITTPESLYLMITSKLARRIFRPLEYVIVDEIHSISSNKRGVHLSLSLERLEVLAAAPPVRIGLSATQKPLETTARFLGGGHWKDGLLHPRPVTIIDTGGRKEMDLRVQSAVPDFADIDGDTVWDAVYPQLANAIARHTSTLIFVNNRRLAERVATKLNNLLGDTPVATHNYAQLVETRPPSRTGNKQPVIVQAYHSSMSRTAREKMEHDLKAGKIRALIATSSLELGIDIGAIDLVIQLQSPKNTARGLQRVGRSGHLVHARSKGRIIATHRQDLLESVVIARSMMTADIESTHVPHNCLDVLAQHIVAAVSMDDWHPDELYALVRQSFCFETLSDLLYQHVLEMLSGRFSRGTLREFHPRISWNKIQNTLSALPGTSRLAILSGGTIPDRGYYPVYLQDRKTKIGELDEEFIHESRQGDTFILGSHVWKMDEIEPQRIIAAPAPGRPARMPFWRGEQPGRSYELCVRVGEFLDKFSQLRDEDAIDWLTASAPVDRTAAAALAEYVFSQKRVTRTVPTHKRIIVESFRDEIGDPRIVVHSCFGKGVNGLLGMLLNGPLSARVGLDVQMLYNDDGILFRCPDVERLPLDLFTALAALDIRSTVAEHVMHSPLFGSLFRQNAARALLLPRSIPGKRTPLWLQRLRAGDLLQAAQTFPDFPIVTETLREALHDTLDIDRFMEVVTDIQSGDIAVETVQTETPSPFASSLLFEFVSAYLYETDKPRGASGPPLSDAVLSEVAGTDAVRKVFEKNAFERIEAHLQHTAPTRRARSREELFEIFLQLGELTDEEVRERCAPGGHLESLMDDGTVSRIVINGKPFFIASEESGLYAPITFADGPAVDHAASLRYILLRTLRTHAAIGSSAIADRLGFDRTVIASHLASLQKIEPIDAGCIFPDDDRTMFYYRANLERIHRASLQVRRNEYKPASGKTFFTFLFRWQHLAQGSCIRDERDINVLLEQFNGYTAPADLWEHEILRPRLQYYDPAALRELCSGGYAALIGHGAGKSAWMLRGHGNVFLQPLDEPCSAPAMKVLALLEASGAQFLSDLSDDSGLSIARLTSAVTELFRAGFITNDSFDELLRLRKGSGKTERASAPAHSRRDAMKAARAAFRAAPGWSGRWSLVRTRSFMGKKLSLEEIVAYQAQLLLRRYGIVTREIVKREDLLHPWPLIVQELLRLEMRGNIRRGYFVEGLSGIQFALPEAAEQIQAIASGDGPQAESLPLIINACDPAIPFFGEREMKSFSPDLRPTRVGTNHIAFLSGTPIIYFEGAGERIWTAEGIPDADVHSAVSEYLRFAKGAHPEITEMRLDFCNGVRPFEGAYADVFRSLGFYRDARQTIRKEMF